MVENCSVPVPAQIAPDTVMWYERHSLDRMAPSGCRGIAADRAARMADRRQRPGPA